MVPLALILSMLALTQQQTGTSETQKTFNAAPIVVFANPDNYLSFTGMPSLRTNSVDELMNQGNISLVRRAAMASEPTIRGLRGGQVVLSIDGMKIHSACVDKMDPATAYVELDNLDRLEVSTGSTDLRYGATAGAALTFRITDPDMQKPLAMNVSASLNSNALQRDFRASVNAAENTTAIRAAYTYRSANNMRAGNSVEIGGSNFAKHNAVVSGTWLVADNNEISIDAIYDLADFIGYPALLMDTRRAEAVIGAVSWKHQTSDDFRLSTKLYANSVDHVMDDVSRTDEEVSNRDFMPNMRMPMYGKTITAGALIESQITSSSAVTNIVMDASYLVANATMDMLPLDPTIQSMTLTNVGDARITTVGVNGSHELFLGNQMSIQANARIDVSGRTLRDEGSREILIAYNPGSSIDQTAVATSLGISYMLETEGVRHTINVASLERLPTHLEMYGFWVFDPQSNLVTVGNPSLQNERSNGIEYTLAYTTPKLSVSLSGSAQWISNYIATQDASSAGTLPNNIALRMYTNVGLANLLNSEGSVDITIHQGLHLGASAKVSYGRAIDVGDPLPLVAPFSGVLRAMWQNSKVSLEGRINTAAAQTNVSANLLPENATPAWVTVDFLSSLEVSDNLIVRASVLNILDVLYHEHMSIRDMPSPGRSFVINLISRW